MAINENIPGLVPAPTGKRKRLGSGLHPLHEAAMRIADIGLNRPREKTRDLVGLLLTHGARAWRSTQPEAKLRIRVRGSVNALPLRMKLPQGE